MMKFLRRLQLCTETRRASVFSLPAVAVSGLPSTIAATAAAERLQVCNSRSDRKRKAENDGLLLTPPSSSLLSLRRCFNVPGPPSLHRAPPISIPLGQRREFRCGEHQRWNCIKAFATVLCQWILWRSFIGKELPPHIVVGMPALLPTMDHGNIAKWQKKEGDKIEVGDVICEIETDKANLEFESLEEGYLAKILASEGSKDVHVGQPIAITVEDPDDSAKVPSTVSSVSNGSEVEEEKSTQGHTETREKVQKTSFSRISPAARLLITEFGLDASSLTASGPRGTLSKGDVLAAIKSGTRHSKTSDSSQVKVSSSAPPQLEHTPKPASVSSSSSLPVDAHEDILNSQIRKVIAKRLLESKRGTPHLYLSSDVILDPLLSFRKELQVQHGVKVSVNDIVIKAVALALRNVSEANAYWNDGKGEATLCESVDISIAVATEKGLMTPIIRNADQKTLSAISAEVKELAGKARAGKLAPHEFQGGTFSISNLGMFPVDHFCAIINPPQAGILAVGRGNKVVAPLVDANGMEKPAVVTKMNLTLSADHRVFDGSIGGRFFSALSANFKDIHRLLL